MIVLPKTVGLFLMQIKYRTAHVRYAARTHAMTALSETVGLFLMQIQYRTAHVRYAAKTRCVSYSLHSLIHSGSCANSHFVLKHAPAFVAIVQLPTEASLSSFTGISSPCAVLNMNT